MNDAVDTNSGMIEFWNGDAGQKWVRFQEMMDRSLLPLGEKAMDVAGIAAGERVIDVGCGCGDTGFQLAGRVGGGGRVLGVDISGPMLERARERADAAGRANLAFELGDAQVYDFEAGAFDLVFSRFGVMFFADPEAAFGNLKSALRPGGRVAFVCWQPARDNPWVRIPVGVVGQHVPLPAPPGPDEPGEFAFGDPARVERILSAAGFADIAIDKFDTPFTAAGGAGLDEAVEFFLQMGPTGRALADAGAGPEVRDAIAADLRAALTPYDTGGGIVMDAATWVVTARNA